MADYLKQLELSEFVVEARIRFLVDRANSHRSEAQKIESGRSWNRIASFGAAGTCLTQAAALSLLLGVESDQFLYRAAQDYLLAEHPYGLFLLGLSASTDEATNLALNSPVESWLRKLDQESSEKSESHAEGIEREFVPPQLMSVNQQMYLCMAMASMPTIAQRNQATIFRMMHLMASHSNLPHGPQGQPLQTQLDILEPVMNMLLGERRSRDITRPMRALSRLSFHYAESIEAARRNSYLWRNVWAPIDYLDIEIVGAAMCLGRVTPEVSFDEIASRDNVASIPFLIARDRLRPRRR